MTKLTPADLRDRATAALKEPGERRRALLAQLAEVDTELRPLVRTAVRMEVSQRQIQTLTGLSRTTVGLWGRDN